MYEIESSKKEYIQGGEKRIEAITSEEQDQAMELTFKGSINHWGKRETSKERITAIKRMFKRVAHKAKNDLKRYLPLRDDRRFLIVWK